MNVHLLSARTILRTGYFLIACLCFTVLQTEGVSAQEPSSKEQANDFFWAAAKSGNIEGIKTALEAGVEVDTQTEYGATALMYASDRGHLNIVKLLLESKADPNHKDKFYNVQAVDWAAMNEQYEVIEWLLANGSDGADRMLAAATSSNNHKLLAAVLDSKACPDKAIIDALKIAKAGGNEETLKLLEAVETDVEPETEMVLTEEELQVFVGEYVGEARGNEVKVQLAVENEKLMLGFGEGTKTPLVPVEENKFMLGTSSVTAALSDDKVSSLSIDFGASILELKPVDAIAPDATDTDTPEAETTKFKPSSKESREADLAVSSKNWPSFRGTGARGIADGQNAPTQWNVAEKENLLWQTAIPGLGLSCPTIWDDHVYVTSAVNEDANNDLSIGLIGDVASVEEEIEYEFRVYCLNKSTGEIVWNQMLHKAQPAVKRHAKSSHANPTVATDGKHVVAFFGSEGLYCLDREGNEIWKKDFGVLDSGWFYDAGYQWGFGSSPIIHDNKVYVQCDIQKGSFVGAFDLETGEEIWKTERDEIPSWSTPTIVQHEGQSILITNATKAARAYSADDGNLLWEIKEHSEIVVPTPFMAHGLVYLASGYSPIQPIFAVRPDSLGDISLASDATTSSEIAWSTKRGGPYMPTPIAYGDYFYCCSNAGILNCYDAKTGDLVYKQRLKAPGGGLSFTASPIAADGKLYLSAEDGRTLIVKTGPEFEQLEVNSVGENVLATPSISEGAMFIRTAKGLISVGAKD